MNNIISKLTSRKFWVTLISVITGIAQLFGAEGELASVLGGVALALVPTVIYVITEGNIDAKMAKELISELSDSLDEISSE